MGWREPLGQRCADSMCDGDHLVGETCYDERESVGLTESEEACPRR